MSLCVTDPPYGLGDIKDLPGLLTAWIIGDDPTEHVGAGGFMSKDWDKICPPPSAWREVYRVLKPGGHLLCFAGTRTADLIGISIRLAGFELRDEFDVQGLSWLYGSGFPKSTAIGKAIDKKADDNIETLNIKRKLGEYLKEKRKEAGLTKGRLDEMLGTNTMYSWYEGRLSGVQFPTWKYWIKLKRILNLDDRYDYLIEDRPSEYIEAEREVIGEGKSGKTAIWNEQGEMGEFDLTAPATPEAAEWEGWGTGLKPAHEPVLVFVKREQDKKDLTDVPDYAILPSITNLLEVVLCLSLNAKFVEKSLTSNQAELKEVSDSVLINAVEKLISEDGESEKMDTFRSPAAASILLSIAWLWNVIWGANSKAMSIFTTSTATELITELKTLSLSTLGSIYQNIIQVEKSEADGLNVFALNVAKLLNGENVKYEHILKHSVPENVLTDIAQELVRGFVSIADKVLTTQTLIENTVPQSVTTPTGEQAFSENGSRLLARIAEKYLRSTGRVPQSIAVELVCQKRLPTHSPILIFRKPLEKGLTVAENCLKWGTGAFNVDAGRVGLPEKRKRHGGGSSIIFPERGNLPEYNAGRFPSNVLFVHDPACRRVGVRRVKSEAPRGDKISIRKDDANVYIESETGNKRFREGSPIYIQGYADPDGLETVPQYACSDFCPVRELDRQSGVLKSGERNPGINTGKKSLKCDTQVRTGYFPPDTGTASRFFAQFEYGEADFYYCAKASKAERNAGLGGEEKPISDGRPTPIDNPYQRGKTPKINAHPTVKPVELLRYLIRMFSRPGDTVFDPFAGSGSTLVACQLEGRRGIGMDNEWEYVVIGDARERYWSNPEVQSAYRIDGELPSQRAELPLFEYDR
jgi:DNA modification methylase